MVLCAVVFLFQVGSSLDVQEAMIYRYGMIPAVIGGAGQLPPDLAGVPAFITPITSMFLHGGWMHIIGNMMFLWIFGDNIEDVLGHVRFIILYALAGLAAAGLQYISAPQSTIPMVGASGAISGVLGAYILLFPKARVLTLVWFGFFLTTIRISALWFLGGWFGLQWVNALLSSGSEGGGVAWWAHIGGFVAGMLALVVLKPRKYLFGGSKDGPWGRR